MTLSSTLNFIHEYDADGRENNCGKVDYHCLEFTQEEEILLAHKTSAKVLFYEVAQDVFGREIEVMVTNFSGRSGGPTLRALEIMQEEVDTALVMMHKIVAFFCHMYYHCTCLFVGE